MFVPHQVKQFNAYNTAQRPTISRPPMPHNNIQQQPAFNSTFQPAPVILSSAPKLYVRPNVPTVEAPSYSAPTSSIPAPNVGGANFDINNMVFDAPTKSSKKSKSDKSQNNHNAEDIIKAAKASSFLQSFGNKDKKKVDKKTVRQAGGTTWEDQSLADW